MKKVLFIAILTCFLATSCSKSSDTPTSVANIYMTLSVGSTWNYENTDIVGGGIVSNYSLVSTNRDSTVSGSLYHVFTNPGGPNEYYNIADNVYSTYKKIQSKLGGTYKLVHYLDLDNDTWSQNFNIVVNGLGQTLNLANTITEKNVTRTVNSKDYSNVICVKTVYSIPTIGPNYLTGYVKSYYAPKYGLIEDSTNLTILPLIPSLTQFITETNKLTSAVLQ